MRTHHDDMLELEKEAHSAGFDADETVVLVRCGTYGCQNLKREGRIFCDACYEDYRSDPEAYK